MNVAMIPPESRQQSVGAVVLSGLKILVAAATDRTTVKAVPRPYSFLSECECPDDCLRDHENE